MPPSVESIEILGRLKPMLILEWEAFVVKNKITKKNIPVPQQVSLYI